MNIGYVKPYNNYEPRSHFMPATPAYGDRHFVRRRRAI